MRAASLAALAVSFALCLGACSSETVATTPDAPSVNSCRAIGGVCAWNFPFRCPPGYEAVTSGDLATSCGRSTPEEVPDVAPFDYMCCTRPYETDTGVEETLDASDADAAEASDAGDAGFGDAADADATDASDATDTRPDVVDAADAG